jgi:hypothetical protein
MLFYPLCYCLFSFSTTGLLEYSTVIMIFVQNLLVSLIEPNQLFIAHFAAWK